MTLTPNLYLVGLMAVGKTTVGRLLAEALHMDFYDSDQEVETRAGADTGWIFDVEGEAGFRDREEQVIEDLTRRQNVVLATGGGAVIRPANRQALSTRGVVLHLDSPLDRLVERTSKDKRRPLLQKGNVRETLGRLMQERAPLYAEVRDYRFVTDRQSPKLLARKIEWQLREDGLIR
jgi:shikimate kinase